MAGIKEKKGVHYQYFWLKLETKENVQRLRKKTVWNKAKAGTLIPLHQVVYPLNLKRLPMVFGQEYSVKMGFQFNPRAFEKSGHSFEVQMMGEGLNRAKANQWIKSREGKAWATGAILVVLCHVAIEPTV